MTQAVTPNETSPRNLFERAILAAVEAGPFHAVVRDRKGGGGLAPLDLRAAPVVSPKSVYTNEVSSLFNDDRRYGRGVRMRKTFWVYQLLLSFNVEVDPTAFESAICNNVPRVEIPEFGTALLRIRTGVYAHPPQGGGGGGSELTYTFDADLGR